VLPQALQIAATSPAGGSHDYVPVGGAATPLLRYATPVTADAVSVKLKQPVGAPDALRGGTYSTTLTFSLSTTTP
jgi:hypothetical protein